MTSIPQTHAYLHNATAPKPLGYAIEVYRLPSGGLKAYACRQDNKRFGDGLVMACKPIPGQPRTGFTTMEEAAAFVAGYPTKTLWYLASQATTRRNQSTYVDSITEAH